jgi:hypothetical protein
MPAFVKVRLTEASGGKDVFINTANVLTVIAADDPNQTLVLLIQDKAYLIDGKLADNIKLLSA